MNNRAVAAASGIAIVVVLAGGAVWAAASSNSSHAGDGEALSAPVAAQPTLTASPTPSVTPEPTLNPIPGPTPEPTPLPELPVGPRKFTHTCITLTNSSSAGYILDIAYRDAVGRRSTAAEAGRFLNQLNKAERAHPVVVTTTIEPNGDTSTVLQGGVVPETRALSFARGAPDYFGYQVAAGPGSSNPFGFGTPYGPPTLTDIQNACGASY